VNDCQDYGIYFSGCGATVISDSILGNLKGGLYLNTSCGITIKNSYFITNYSHGAIYAPNDIFKPVNIIDNYFNSNGYDNYLTNNIAIIFIKSDSILFNENYFINNSYSGTSAGKLISFQETFYGPDTASELEFTNNYIGNNLAINGTSIMFADYFHSAVIRDNSFVNNSVGDYNSAIAGINSCTFDTIECNLFLDNQSGNNAGGVLSVSMNGPTLINRNIFDGNFNSSADQTSVAHIDCTGGGTDTCYFMNNTIRNNSSPSGPCIEFLPHIINQKVLQIRDNNFENNIANGVIKLTGNNTGNINLDFLYLKHNNFTDPNAQSELYNNIPYGSPDVYADSNFWNGAGIQHLDSVIYDYFDSGNLSVVFYQPGLFLPVLIDTACNGIATIVPETTGNFFNSSVYPNPFSDHTTLVIEKKLSDAVLIVFNRFGQQVRKINHLSGNNINIDRANLQAGIYFFQILDKSILKSNGKLVIME
jgi:hypothetical protein